MKQQLLTLTSQPWRCKGCDVGVLLFLLGVWAFLAAVQGFAPDYFLAAAVFAGGGVLRLS